MKRLAITIIIVLCFVSMIRWYNRADNGITNIGKNVVLLEGECVVINWTATEHEAELALRRWQQLKYIARR